MKSVSNRWARPIAVVAACAVVASCGLPQVGPNKKQIFAGSVQREGDAFVVSVSDRVTRATAILFALESGLDMEAGGPLSGTLQRLYAGARSSIVGAAIGDDPAPFHAAADEFDGIAQAWATARAA